MKNKSRITTFLTLFALLISAGILTSCSSKSPGPTTVKQRPVDWDHKTIREQREAEKAQGLEEQSSIDDEESSDLKCKKVSKAEMRKARLSGCRPLDPREGHGVDMFCCTNN